MNHKYTMTISRLTVDKLGVKLYDRVSAVIAETVANSYDADATKVTIRAPMSEWLAMKAKGKVSDRGFAIEVVDTGCGMTVEEVNKFYLKVGGERRDDPKRGDVSKKYQRRVMGRKGVGKLAPFGVCNRVEVITAGGSLKEYRDEAGAKQTGYEICHLILERGEILSDTDVAYPPEIGSLDGKYQATTGTTIRMKLFDHRRVPVVEDFERQMAQRFGLTSSNWSIVLQDSQKKSGDEGYERTVGDFQVSPNSTTKITFARASPAKPDSHEPGDYSVSGPVSVSLNGLQPGFTHEDRFYPVVGWVGYAVKPYKDELMAGIRIYCRGKIAAQTKLFELTAGFTGEHDVRSYLIGELHADWLDEAEDLIRTDRQDILWSQDLGQAFQTWGQSLVKLIGKITREPMRKSTWEKFRTESKIEERVETAFPGMAHKQIREQTLEIAEKIAKTARVDELEDRETIESFVQLSLLLGPHITLDRKLKEAAEMENSPMAVVSAVLKVARIAELASFGRIADDRVRVIERLQTLKDSVGTDESDFQELLTEAPWLINPEWSPITSNQTFGSLKKELIKFHEKRTKERLVLEPFGKPKKRADFVLSSEDNTLRIVEIKNPGHKLQNGEMDRIITYHDLLADFLAANEEFRKHYARFEITLVCDDLALSGAQKTSFQSYKRDKVLEYLNWGAFMLKTKRTHQAFLDEADRQRKIAAHAP